ncbi:beta-alanine-activating enzyme [Pectinophora gossypiella]|uniref:beta-alanine-activating enzyme n=1 Tax=Pectinophora gossypiella TaxID=13191 RepID=UPI00214F02C4|nr:beta-alanine-activating enzyme [Pectinophora gossypiella]
MKYKRGYYDVFVRTCAVHPSRVAVRLYQDNKYKCYTYSELYGVCEYISQQLQQLHCNKGVIGLVSKTNIIVPCVIAAAHKCCTTFMFVDPSQDVDSIIEDMSFTVIISIMEEDDSDNLSTLFRKPDRTFSVFGMSICFYDYGPPPQQSYKFSPEHSFIAMTSGSTGDPKKIQVPVQCIQPNIEDLTNLFHITPDDIIYFSTPLTFDPSMVEILLACMNGASLLIAPTKVDILFPSNSQHAVTVWQTTPSLFFQLSTIQIRNKVLSAKSPLKILALGGEPLNGVRRLKELKDANNGTKLFALYGVTEMSCWACVAELDLDKISQDREVPLGRCLSETKVVVEKEPSSEKSLGKIVLLTKTRKCFILNRSDAAGSEINSLKFVDTGDLAEVENGTMYYRGRQDDVIKRFGHKINLQSIENTVMQCPRIKTCSCVWLPKPKVLHVYYSSETFSSQDLSDYLKCKLDDKHWPDRIIRVDNMPVNSHGKISKVLLAKMYDQFQSTPLTTTSLKVKLLNELKRVLNFKGTYDDAKGKDFFSLGGTSFLAVTMCNSISLTNPDFGKFLLPHLMNHRKSIDEIMDLATREVFIEAENPKKRKKSKNSVSESESVTVTDIIPSKKKLNSPISAPLEFIEMWTYNTGKCVDASPALLQTGLNLYVAVGSHSGRVVVIDAMTGIVVGTIELKSRIEAAVCCYSDDPGFPPCGVVGSYNGTVVCFIIETCQVLWQKNIGSMIKSKAACCNGFIYIASYDGYIRSLDLVTGKTKEIILVADQAISADLVLAKNEYILTGTLSGVCASIHTATNSVAWRGTLESPVFASPVLYDEDKYVIFSEVSGEIHCRTVEKGIKIWKYSGAKGNLFSSICIREIDKLKYQMVFGCHDNHVYSIIVKNFQPSLQWKVPLSSPVYSTPCKMTDKLFLAVSNNGKLCVITADYGMVIAEHNLPSETFSSPAIYGDYIFIGCRNDLVYSLRYVLNL